MAYSIENDSIQHMLELRASELFKMCDLDDKGFINKYDIQRIKEPFGFSAEALEQVFELLDTDNNGYLTPHEFTLGFSKFMENQMDDLNQFKSINNNHMNVNEDEEDDNNLLFKETMQSLGANELVEKYKKNFILFRLCEKINIFYNIIF